MSEIAERRQQRRGTVLVAISLGMVATLCLDPPSMVLMVEGVGSSNIVHSEPDPFRWQLVVLTATVDERQRAWGSRSLRPRHRNGIGPDETKLRRQSAGMGTPADGWNGAGSSPQATNLPPDGHLISWRRHANGRVAAVIGHDNGLVTARQWPPQVPYCSGLIDLEGAQRIADSIAHPECNGIGCGPWRKA